MSETIFKLQPDRTIHLRGFDHFGSAAAMHSATPSSFAVTGVFRDAADFAVLTLYDADNFFEHPRLKYLPDFNFAGLTLQFDVLYSGLMPLNCRKYPSIDWPFLDVIAESGSTAKIRLSDHATVIANPDLPAAGVFTFDGANLNAWDRVTLWYQNLAFDYIVPGKIRTVHEFYASGSGAQHSILVGARSYVYSEQAGDGSADVASHLVALVNGLEGGQDPDPEIQASIGEQPWQVMLERRLDTGGTVTVGGSGGIMETLHHVKTATVIRALRDQINAADYETAQTPFALTAVDLPGGQLRISTLQGGYDANFITIYSTAKNENLRTLTSSVKLSGGESTATLRVTLDFSALGISSIRKMWLTFAPRLADSEEYQPEEWQAQFFNWNLSGPLETRRLQVAGPGSVRHASTELQCTYTGDWTTADGFYMDNTAKRSTLPGSTATIRYYCAQSHDLWLGTELGFTGGSMSVELDATPIGGLSTYLADAPPVVTRRRLAANVPAGEHTVRLTVLSGPVVFDFLEAAVASGIPEDLPSDPKLSPALDYSTDHTFKLPPARILWNFKKLGYTGPMNEYLGVFWWNERVRSGGLFPERRLQFSGDFAGGDSVWVSVSGQLLGKSVFPADTASSIANHFKYIINSTLVGIWAEVVDTELIIRGRSAAPAYQYSITGWVDRAAGSTGAVTGGGLMSSGSMGVWVIDPAAENGLNAGARAWHADFFQQAAAHSVPLTVAMSMELVNPPDSFAARYPDGAPVLTDVGFAGLISTHCAFRSDVLAYQSKVFIQVASMMAAAGLTPELQCGEFTWWYFTNKTPSNPAGGMAYYDSETTDAAISQLGRALHVFTSPNDNPLVNGAADANFLRSRLHNHLVQLMAAVRAAVSPVTFEVLFPYDVNYPEPKGMHQIGGRLNAHVNLPTEWSYPSPGLDRFKLEMLNFGAWSRDLNLVTDCLNLPATLGWPGNKVRLMAPIFRGGYPWEREVRAAFERGFSAVNLWAFDHICLFALDRERNSRRAGYQG